ncbi:hypothetical protein CYG49_04435 [Candidatus Saccharibacteria bacterium]|nr:MAG: hypothetical protein CYG49_04435 [Candidatus Saccharibacteria bacterium]
MASNPELLDQKQGDDSTAKPNKHTHKSTGRLLLGFAWPVVGMLLGYFAAGLLLGVLLVALVPLIPNLERMVENQRNIYIIFLTSLVGNILIVPIVGLTFKRYLFGKNAKLLDIVGLRRRPTLKDVGITLATFIVYFVTTIIVTGLISQVLPQINLNQKQDLGFDRPTVPVEYFIVFLTVVILPPLLEEFVFRGYMFGALRKQLSFWPATIIVSIAFGAVHGQLNVAIDTFILSIFLCLLREKTDSLWPCILLHAAKNGLAFTLLFLFPELLPTELR